MIQNSKELDVAIETAKIGADIALSYYQTDLEIELKEDRSPVTVADKAAEEEMKRYILSHYPKVHILAEESGGDRLHEEFWIVDPIDGTRSFARGIPWWCNLTAFFKNGEVVVGVCYFPVTDSILYAEKGKGCFLNGKKVTVSDVDDLKRSYIAYGSPRYFPNKEVILDLASAGYVSRSPDPTYAAFLVATGKYETVITANAKTWDAAPFALIIAEAGGTFTNLHGEPWTIHDVGYIASNGKIHKEIVSIVNKETE